MPTIYVQPCQKSSPVTSPAGRIPTHRRLQALASFSVNPDGLRFETQQKDEEVVLFLRQHVIVLLPGLLLFVVLMIAPPILFPFLYTAVKELVAIPAGYVIVSVIFWYVCTFGVTLARFLRWFFNIYIVTDRRIVDIDFVHFLYKEFSEANLIHIQDSTYSSGGIVATLFNYGDVLIQTAGKLPNFDFKSVPQPETVVRTIGELTQRVRTKKV